MSLFFDYEGFGEDFSVPQLSPREMALELLKPSGVDRLQEAVSKQRRALAKQANRPASVRMWDKLSFTLGVANIAFAAFVWGKWPQYAYLVYSIKFPILLGLRAYMYHSSNDHYFMFDFCYFANALVMAFLWLFPDSCWLFHTAFSFTNGPLVWAVVAWRNSLVFHSLDKITSVYIHLTPTLLLWAMRWFPSGEFNTCQMIYPEQIPFMVASILPLLPYLVWQALYAIKVEVIDSEKIEKRGLTTSFRFLSSSDGHIVAKLVNFFGKQRWKQISMFMLVQLVYTLLTMSLVSVWWSNFGLHTVFLTFVALTCAWNGANFYFEVFSKRYEDTMRQYAQQWKQVDDVLQDLRDRNEIKTCSSR